MRFERKRTGIIAISESRGIEKEVVEESQSVEANLLYEILQELRKQKK